MKARSIGLVVVGIAVVAGLAYFGLRPQPVPVDLAVIARGPMQITIGADGQTRIRDVYDVAAPIAGRVERSPVAVGDTVVAGKTVVAVVRPEEPALLDARARLQAMAAVHEAEAALAVAGSHVTQAEEDLAYAESQYQRTKALVERRVASLTQLEDAEQVRRIKAAALESARSERAMSMSSLARARATLIEPTDGSGDAGGEACCVTLFAPVDGVVLDIAEISERPVQPGTQLLSLGRRDNLEIVADLLSADAVRIAVGARAHVERWGGTPALEARVRRIEPTARTKVSALGIEEQRVDVVFDLVTPPAERLGLGHGFAVYLRIVEWEAADIVQLPLSAAFRQGEQWYVFVEDAGLARQVPVQIGRRNGQAAEVLDGLQPGQRVVTHPSDRVNDGVGIVPRDAG